MPESYYFTQNINNLIPSSKYEISNLESAGTIIFISDPSGADIYIDGVLQTAKTSVALTVPTGNRDIIFKKAGYTSYYETVSGLKQNQTTKVAAILDQTADIIDSGIVICTTTSISSCPTTPVICPTTINPLDYINFIAKISSTTQKTVTVRFTYTLDDITYNNNVVKNLQIGNNIVYAWSTNRRYDVDTTVTLINVSLV
jgi:PEGA domain